MKKKTIAITMAAAIIAATLSACGSNQEETAAASTDANTSTEASSAKKTELNVATELMATTNEPATGWDSWYVQRYGIGECLIRNGDDGTMQPWLADSWSVADDELTWTFNIKPGVKFSNGTDMTPTKVVESIERLYRLTDPANGGEGLPQAYMTYSSITADDEAGTVTIVTDKPTPDMPGVVAYPWMMIVDAEATENIDTITSAPICTGPYVMDSFTEGLEIKLSKNPYYYDEVPFENVNVMRIAESSSRTMALQDGSADLAINIAATDRKMLEDSGYNVEVTAGGRVCDTFFNFSNPVLADSEFRHAFNKAIDGETVANVTTNGAYMYGYAVVPSSYDYGYDELKWDDGYDPEAAMKILDDAGYVDTDGDGYRESNGKNIELNYVVQANRSMDLIAQAVMAQLDEVGIKANIQLVEHLNDYLSNGNYDIINASISTMPTGDPGSYFSRWRTGATDNSCGYSNPEFDEIFDKMIVEFDSAKRRDYIIQLQQIIIDDAAARCNGYYATNVCYTSAITDVVNNPSEYYWINKDIKPAE